jgi:hypothetical protein
MDDRKTNPACASPLATWIYEFQQDWAATLVVGFLVVSYWRGTWTLVDLYTCDQSTDATAIRGDTFCFGVDPTTKVSSAWACYLVGNVLLALGVHLLWTSWWIPAGKSGTVLLTGTKAVQRTLIVYILGAATVSIWRGIWYLTDYLILPNDPLTSWWITAVGGMTGAFLLLAGSSLLAPPAIFILDGPGMYSPPVAVTILSSYYSMTLPVSKKPPSTSTSVYVADAFLSFVILPVFVVWFWRGCWSLLDQYLWGFTQSTQDLHYSMAYGTALAVGLLFLGSDDMISLIPPESWLMSNVVGRVRTFALAIGSVSFWRVTWLLWDEFCGGTTHWSAWLSHVLGVGGLLVLGCLSCILAPPSTLGVDAVPHEDAADEPLFHNVPLPLEAIFLCGIGRQPHSQLTTDEEATKPPSCLLERQRPEFLSGGSCPRLTRQTPESVTGNLLSERNANKRLHNQFFRSR